MTNATVTVLNLSAKLNTASNFSKTKNSSSLRKTSSTLTVMALNHTSQRTRSLQSRKMIVPFLMIISLVSTMRSRRRRLLRFRNLLKMLLSRNLIRKNGLKNLLRSKMIMLLQVLIQKNQMARNQNLPKKRRRRRNLR